MISPVSGYGDGYFDDFDKSSKSSDLETQLTVEDTCTLEGDDDLCPQFVIFVCNYDQRPHTTPDLGLSLMLKNRRLNLVWGLGPDTCGAIADAGASMVLWKYQEPALGLFWPSH